MAKYTIELRKIIDLFGREQVEEWFKNYCLYDYLTEDEINVIEKTNIWNKDKLARKIVDHYYMREIGFETPALFKHYVKVKMQEIMEEKLPLIYSSSIKYDPLVNVDYHETLTRNIDSSGTNKGSSSSTSSNDSSGISVESDTPQGQINKQSILNGNYASNTTASETETTIQDSSLSSSSNTNETEENYDKHVKGNSGVSATAQKMIEQYRNNIRAIDKEIIEELNILFMGLY